VQNPLRLGIVGCGLITDAFHLPAALGSSLWRLAGVVDSNIERALSLKRKYGCGDIVVSTDIQDIVPHIDAAVIATPNHTHAPLATMLLEGSIPVLVEKPLAISYAEAMQLCELSARTNTPVGVGYHTRHFPSVLLFKSLLDSGFLGSPRSFHYEHGNAGGWAPLSGYNLDRKTSGGGVLVVSGSHFLDRMFYWFGEPSSFQYADDSFGGVEANCKAALQFDNEYGRFSGSLFLSKTIDLRNCFYMETDRYRVEMKVSDTEGFTLYPLEAPQVRMRVGPKSTEASPDYYRVQLEHFAGVVRREKEAMVDGLAGARSVQLFEQFYVSRVQLDEPWLEHFRRAGAAR
jgi:predicted dehydrogenase